MMKELKIYRFGFLLICIVFASSNLFGQDLGSTSGLFRSSNPSSKNTSTSSAKKSTPKTKTYSSAVKRTTPKRKSQNTAKSNTADTRPGNNQAQKKITPPVKIPPPNNIVITVGTPASGNYDEFFEQAIEEGNAARDERDYVKAESTYLRAQSLKPRDSRAIYGLGNLFSDQQRWEEAERAYRTAIVLEPNSPEAHIALSYVLTQPIVGGNLSERYAEAEKMARKAIQLDSMNPFAFDQLGVALELRGNISQETQNAYRRAIRLEPAFALAYAHLGRLLRRNGLVNESSEAYRKAVQYSNDVPTMILVADVMQSQQRYTESEQLLRNALRLDPKNPTALLLLGRALTTRNSFDEAEKVLKKSVEVSPKSVVSHSLLGSLYLRRGRLDEAEKSLMNALKVASPNENKRLAQEFELVGDAFMRIGNKNDARRVYRQAAALDAANSVLANKLAKAG